MSQTSVRRLLLLGLALSLGSCAASLPAAETTPPSAPIVSVEASASAVESAADEATVESAAAAPSIVHAPALTAEQLLRAAGSATYLVDHDLRVASIDSVASERWITRRPSAVFLYAERPIETATEVRMRGACQRLPVWPDIVVGALSVGLTRHGRERVVLEVEDHGVAVEDQRIEDGFWSTHGVRGLGLGVIALDDDHIVFAEGAEIREVACVNSVRAVLCAADADPWVGPRGYCLDRALVVRPWRPAFVPHVGPVWPAYPEVYPSLPEGHCEVECAPSACEDALPTAQLPHVPLYTEEDPVLAVFRTQAACRAFAASRPTPALDGVW